MRREHHDVLVIGAGPSGLAAAQAAARNGSRVGLVDDNPVPGGQIWRGGRSEGDRQRTRYFDAIEHDKIATSHAARVVAKVGPKALVLETATDPFIAEYETLILATGARERFVPFPGWDLPNVCGLGGLQALMKSGLDVRGKQIVLAGTGPLLVAVAAMALDRGAKVVAVLEQAPFYRAAWFGLGLLAHFGKLKQAIGLMNFQLARRMRFSAWPTHALGDATLDAVELRLGPERVETHACDILACAYGLVPNLELASLLGCDQASGAVTVDAWQQTSQPAIYACGEATGISGLDGALAEGAVAGHHAAGDAQAAATHTAKVAQNNRFARRMDSAFRLREELRSLPDDETIICRCEDVRYRDLVNQPSWRAAKLHTRCGMGPCQGRVCGAASAFLFDAPAQSVRPPLFPASVAILAAATDSPIEEPSTGGSP